MKISINERCLNPVVINSCSLMLMVQQKSPEWLNTLRTYCFLVLNLDRRCTNSILIHFCLCSHLQSRIADQVNKLSNSDLIRVEQGTAWLVLRIRYALSKSPQWNDPVEQYRVYFSEQKDCYRVHRYISMRGKQDSFFPRPLIIRRLRN